MSRRQRAKIISHQMSIYVPLGYFGANVKCLSSISEQSSIYIVCGFITFRNLYSLKYKIVGAVQKFWEHEGKKINYFYILIISVCCKSHYELIGLLLVKFSWNQLLFLGFMSKKMLLGSLPEVFHRRKYIQYNKYEEKMCEY